MSKVAKQRWLFANCAVLPLAALAVWVLYSHAPQTLVQATQQEEGTARAANPAERAAVLSALRDAGLALEDMAALNLSQVQASAVFSAGRTWLSSNRDSLRLARQTEAHRQSTLFQARRQARIGTLQGGSEQLAAARQQLAEAQSAVESQLNSLRSALAGQFTTSQASLWSVMRTNTGQPMPERLLQLTAEQRTVMQDARDSFRAAMAEASTSESRTSAESALHQNFDAALSSSDRSMISAVEDYGAASLGNVMAGLNDVLPAATPHT